MVVPRVAVRLRAALEAATVVRLRDRAPVDGDMVAGARPRARPRMAQAPVAAAASALAATTKHRAV